MRHADPSGERLICVSREIQRASEKVERERERERERDRERERER